MKSFSQVKEKYTPSIEIKHFKLLKNHDPRILFKSTNYINIISRKKRQMSQLTDIWCHWPSSVAGGYWLERLSSRFWHWLFWTWKIQRFVIKAKKHTKLKFLPKFNYINISIIKITYFINHSKVITLGMFSFSKQKKNFLIWKEFFKRFKIFP